MTVKEAACAYLDSGLSVIPTDKPTKKPKVSTWAAFQQLPASKEQVSEWFQNGAALAVICGKVSGNLEVIDFDKPGVAKEWANLLRSWNCEGILSKLVIERSQRGGTHAAYRFSGEPQGNQKLALSHDKAVKIETRGEGGYCLTAPTDGYSLKQGSWTNLPVLTGDERDVLLSAARYFDECPKVFANQDKGRVGDDYNARASLAEIVIPKGWTQAGKTDFWTRPGKSPKDGHSASWNHQGNRHFVVFSSSAGIEPGAYDLFGLYARLHHGGDFVEATKAAAASGYGESTRDTVRRVNSKPEPREEKRRVLCLEDIEEETIEFLIEPYFPIGCGYTLLYGDSDQGKSTATLALIAGWSNGKCPVTGKSIEPIKSLILSAEDSAQYVVKPRLKMLGANMKNIFAPEEFREESGITIPDPMRLDEWGAEELQEMVRDTGARVVVIDPLTAYFDGNDMNNRQDARAWSSRLTRIAIAENCVVIVVHHVSKPNGQSGGRYRAAGSQDFFDAARSGLMVCHAGEGTTEYALSHEKHNYSWRGESIGYEFSREKGFQWTGVSDLTADLAAARQEEHVEPKKKDACKRWILEQLEQGPMSSDDLLKGAKLEGWKYATYRRAKDELRDQVRSWKSGGEGCPWMNELRQIEDPYAD